MERVFILSPARAGGKRGELLVGERARCALALRLRQNPGVRLGEIFTFLSGLYFRGKLAYARAFARHPPGIPGVWVITPHRGLLDVETMVNLRQLRAFSRVDIDLEDDRYRRPLERDVRSLARKLSRDCQVVLLGSISTGKYCTVLLETFGERLYFPKEFVGRGDMSRGGLLLRSVADQRELEYSTVAGTVRRGRRPPKLMPRSWKDTFADFRHATPLPQAEPS